MATKTYCAYAMECLMTHLTESRTRLKFASVSDLWDLYHHRIDLSAPLEAPTPSELYIWYSHPASHAVRIVDGLKETNPLDRAIQTAAISSYACLPSLFVKRNSNIYPRIDPIICTRDELQGLQVNMVLLHNFQPPTKDPMAWELGRHGIRISLDHPTLRDGKRAYKAYTPSDIRERGFPDKPTVIASLMSLILDNIRSVDLEEEWDQYNADLVTFEGESVGLSYRIWAAWKEWAIRQPESRINGAYEEVQEDSAEED
ncbi:hypothetical protein K470DRAFT_256758 [Piedraia hortae CBS 480.64]|uniref:Uncharacterized protein n=1 Tax=Piedraia hortae CBS 480.64 TaxID=1314780 RepID=A0A6A7C301_9PEZI|nr:hypothetical protein K470DRAFT_256758 [Piedraia hortae CBS 480.64]